MWKPTYFFHLIILFNVLPSASHFEYSSFKEVQQFFSRMIPLFEGWKMPICQSYWGLEKRCVLVSSFWFSFSNLKTNISLFRINHAHAHLLVNGSLNNGLHRSLWLTWCSLGTPHGLNIPWPLPDLDPCFMHTLSFLDSSVPSVCASCEQNILPCSLPS